MFIEYSIIKIRVSFFHINVFTREHVHIEWSREVENLKMCESLEYAANVVDSSRLTVSARHVKRL